MSLLRRPVATVLSVASTVVVGGVAWGLVSAHADGAVQSAPAPVAPAVAPVASTPPVAAPSATRSVASSAATAVPPQAAPGAAPRAVTPAPRPATPAAKYTVPTTVTIQAINKTVGEGQLYRAVFRGVLTATPKRQALTQHPVVLMVRVKGASAWTRAVTAVSSAPDGKLLVAVTQEAVSADYRFVFDAKSPYKASTSAIVTVKRA